MSNWLTDGGEEYFTGQYEALCGDDAHDYVIAEAVRSQMRFQWLHDALQPFYAYTEMGSTILNMRALERVNFV